MRRVAPLRPRPCGRIAARRCRPARGRRSRAAASAASPPRPATGRDARPRVRQAGRRRRRRARDGQRAARRQDRRAHVGDGDRRLGDRGLLPLPRQEVRGDHDVARAVSGRSSGRLDARFTIPEDYGGVHDVIALIDGKPVAQNGIEVTQSFEMTPDVRPGRHADRAQGQGARLADDGKHVGGELGQQRARLRVGGGHAGIGGRAISRRRVRQAITSSSCSPAGRGKAT